MQSPGSGGGTPGGSNTLPPPGAVPPNPQGSIPPNPQGIPSNPPGSVPSMPGGTLGDQGGATQPGDQLGMTNCAPSGTDRGGLSNRSGQDLPGSNRSTPPPLLPPSGG
ncbi:MAG: hypothetical protein HY282_12245 [Nitrospirae bacterium]|nr:hypothetical protein [Candidatus Manganitrophaceae bacterium]